MLSRTRVVRTVVAVEEIKMHAADLCLPGAQPQFMATQADLEPRPFSVCKPHRPDWKLLGFIVGIQCLLRAITSDHLPEITLLIQQAHADAGHAEIAGRFQRVAGDVAEAAGIDRQCFAQHEFHAEVPYPLQHRAAVGAPKPMSVRTRRLACELGEPLDASAEFALCQRLTEALLRNRVQDEPGIVRPRPEFWVEPAPQLVGCVVPGPSQIKRQLTQQRNVGLEVGYARLIGHAAGNGTKSPPSRRRGAGSRVPGWPRLVTIGTLCPYNRGPRPEIAEQPMADAASRPTKFSRSCSHPALPAIA